MPVCSKASSIRSGSPSTTLAARSASLPARRNSPASWVGRLRPMAKVKPGRPDSSSRSSAEPTRRPASPSASGTSTAIWPASSTLGVAIAPPATERAARRARASRRRRQSSSVATRGWARAMSTVAPEDRSLPSSLPRASRSSGCSICPASTARRNVSAASSEARSGARTRSTSEAMSVVTRRSSEPSGVRSRARMRRRPTETSATLSSIVVTSSVLRMSERSSAGERAATASTVAERSMRIRLASSARAAERRISGRPAPASTASVIAPRAE